MVMRRQSRLDEAAQATSQSLSDFEAFIEPLVFAEVRGNASSRSRTPVAVGVAYWHDPEGYTHSVMCLGQVTPKQIVEDVDKMLSAYLAAKYSQMTSDMGQGHYHYGVWELPASDAQWAIASHQSQTLCEDGTEESPEDVSGEEPEVDTEEPNEAEEDTEPKKWDEQTVRDAAEDAGIDISEFDMDQLVAGMQVELEHGKREGDTDITSDDPVETLKIVLAHMRELPDYYTLLDDMEKAGKARTKAAEARRRRVVEQDKKQLSIPTTSRWGVRIQGGPWVVVVDAKSAEEAKELIRADLMSNRTRRDFWHQWEAKGAPVEKVGDKDPRDTKKEATHRPSALRESFVRHYSRKR
jgi:hypothetical protein